MSIKNAFNSLRRRCWESLANESAEIDGLQIFLLSVIHGVVGSFVSIAYFGTLQVCAHVVWKYFFYKLQDAGLFSESFPEYNFVWMGSLPYILLICVLTKVFQKTPVMSFGPAIEHVHTDGLIPSSQFIPTFIISALTLTSASGIGPEAPVLILGGSYAAYLGEKLQLPKRSLRRFVLTGVFATLSAFFGSPITGIFALEFPHRLGIEYFEAFIPGLISSFISSTIYQAVYNRPFGSFFFYQEHLIEVRAEHVLIAVGLGLFSSIFSILFWACMKGFGKFFTKIRINRIPVLQPLYAWVTFAVIGMFLPPMLFWGEPELQNVIDMNVDSPLPHWMGGSSGIINLGTPYTLTAVFMIGIVKLISLALNINIGLKGGIVFPLFFIGGTLGQAMFVAVQAEPKLQALFVCCVMASVQSAVTRTPFSSSLLVLMLSQGVVVYLFIPVAVAAYVANFVTYKFEVFPQQRQREDLVFVNEKHSILDSNGTHRQSFTEDEENIGLDQLDHENSMK